MRRGHDLFIERLALLGRQLLGIVEPFGHFLVVEHHGADHHRPRLRPATGLVDARHHRCPAPDRPPLELEVGNFDDDLGRIGRHTSACEEMSRTQED